MEPFLDPAPFREIFWVFGAHSGLRYVRRAAARIGRKDSGAFLVGAAGRGEKIPGRCGSPRKCPRRHPHSDSDGSPARCRCFGMAPGRTAHAKIRPAAAGIPNGCARSTFGPGFFRCLDILQLAGKNVRLPTPRSPACQKPGAAPALRRGRCAGRKKRRLHRLFLISPSAPGRIVLQTIQSKHETAAAVRLAPFWPKTRPMAPGAEMVPTARPQSDGGRVRLRRARCRHACKPDRLRPD